MNKRSTGSRYETYAAAYLEGHGYRIIEKNFRSKTGEIDLIAREGDFLVFIEVKYRQDSGSGSPEEAVNGRKQERILRTAQSYMAYHCVPDSFPCRFDVVAIEGDQIRLVRNAFGGLA